MAGMLWQSCLPEFDRAELMNYNPGPNDFYRFFREMIMPFIDPEPFMVLYDPENGKPPIDPTIMLGALVLYRLEHGRLDQFAYHLKTDVAYQYALALTAPGAKIPSYSALRSFQRKVRNYFASTRIDLVRETFISLAKYFSEMADVDTDTVRIDSFLIDVYAKDLSRYQLVYCCIADVLEELSKKKHVEIPEQLQHYLDPADFNNVSYHDKATSDEKKEAKLMKEASLVLDTYAKDYSHLKTFKLLQRCLAEQTVVSENGVRSMREKGDPVLKGITSVVCNDMEEDQTIKKSPILQTPTDPEATYNGKRNENHQGYVGTVIEASGQYGPILQGYVICQNIVGDNKMALELVRNMPMATGDRGATVGDAAFCGDALRSAVEDTHRVLITTNLSGRKASAIFADLEFNEDGIVTKCPGGHAPIDATLNKDTGNCRCHFELSACANCPHREECHPDKQKKAYVRTFTRKMQIRGASVKYRKTEEFSRYSAFRNGVEAIFSLLRRAYGIDCIPVYGLDQITIRLGLDLLAVNVCKFYLRMMKKLQAA